MKTKFNILFAALAALGGCSLAPAYKTPNMPVAQTWGEEDIYQTQKNFDVQAMALESFIRDERLLQIIRTALSDNRDLKSRLVDAQAARALYQTERAKLLPSIYAGGSGGEAKTRAAGKEKNYTGEVGLSAFELDLFGKNRSAKNSKKEQYFARLEEVRSAEILLTAQTASAWVTLASDREMLKIARETVKSAQESANIAKRRFEAGVTSKLDLYQAQTILHQAQADVADYTAVVAQDRHALELLAGGAVSEELLPSDLEQVHEWFGDVQAGTSSSVLLHRPDIRAAEHTLKSANADIGAARAEFFPVISLVAATGLASAELSKLFSDASSVWSYMGDINIPIFSGGEKRANLKYAKAKYQAYLAQYEYAVQTAFKEVKDELVRRATIYKQIDAQKNLLFAAKEGYYLARTRYERGIDTYMNVLELQRTYYDAERALISTTLTEVNNRISLYKALGGGTQDIDNEQK